MRRAAALLAAAALAACSHHASRGTATPASTTAATTTTTAVATTEAPASADRPLTAADLPASWRAGCPVAPAQVRRVSVEFWGFDDQPHTGTLIVSERVVTAVTTIFGRLRAAKFPIHRMEPIDAFGGDDEKSLDADNTAAFNCRRAVAAGAPRWSVHAYGEAIDVNPVENPYIDRGVTHPSAGAAFTTRSPYRPGMAVSGGELVRAFAASGWQWGGRWTASPDYQHFSATGG